MGMRSVRAARRSVVVVVTGAIALLAPPAQAQADEAFITVDQAHPASGSTHYFVSVAGADGSPITDTEVVATPIDPDGTEHEPVTFDSSGDGVHQGVVPMNEAGEWTVRFTSADPPASTEHLQRVSAANTSIETVPSAEAPTPTDGAATTEPGPGAAAPVADDDSGSSALPLVLLLVGLVLLLAIVAALVARNRKQASGDNTDDPPRDLDA